MTKRTIALLAALLAFTLLLKVITTGADEDDEKEAIPSNVAHLSRDSTGRVIIALGTGAQKDAGIATAVLAPVARRIEIEAYGVVLNPEPLATLDRDLAGARAALQASRAQYERTRQLYAEQKNASLRDLQSAQASYLADRSRCQMLEQQLRNDWGNAIAAMSAQARLRLVDALIDRRQALARLAAPLGAPLEASGPATLFLLGYEDQPLLARAVYGAPSVARGMQGQTLLVLLEVGRVPIPPGTALSARLPAASGALVHGVMVTRSAIVRYAGRTWLYQALDGGRFTRRPITAAQVTEQGYFVTDLAPGTRIVVRGAQTLLSAELKNQIRVED